MNEITLNSDTRDGLKR